MGLVFDPSSRDVHTLWLWVEVRCQYSPYHRGLGAWCGLRWSHAWLRRGCSKIGAVFDSAAQHIEQSKDWRNYGRSFEGQCASCFECGSEDSMCSHDVQVH